MKNVYMITGINGIGKSTLVDNINRIIPNVLPVYASKELRNIFGDISREELELMSTELKLAKKTQRLISLFEQALDEKRTIILDSHLLVPIRDGNIVRYENTWSDEYSRYISNAVMLVADPCNIYTQRFQDEKNTGRKRDLSILNIENDQNRNIREFKLLIDTSRLPTSSILIKNDYGKKEVFAEKIIESFRIK